jgi:hypothetical protein
MLGVVSEPAMKAAGMNNLVRTVRARVSAVAFERARDAASPEVRALIDRPPLPVAWVPLRLGHAVEDVLCEALGDDLAAITEAAAEAGKEDLGTVYRAFLKLASPRLVAGRIPSIYATYTRDAGSMRVTGEGHGEGDRATYVEITLEGYPTPTPRFYALRRGNLLGGLRATGAKNGRCEIVKGGGRTASCVYRVSWG